MLAEFTNECRVQIIHNYIPESLLKALTMLLIEWDGFQKFIVCLECNCLYEYNEYINKRTREIARCSYIRFPRHPQRRMRTKCNQPITKIVKTTGGKRTFAPLKVFVFKRIIESIQNLIQQPENLELFNHWRDRELPSNVMADIYDGAVWKEFLHKDGKELLSSRYGFGLSIKMWIGSSRTVMYSIL